MPRLRSPLVIVLTPTERSSLETIRRATRAPHSKVQRAQIVLRFAAGESLSQIARSLDLQHNVARKWVILIRCQFPALPQEVPHASSRRDRVVHAAPVGVEGRGLDERDLTLNDATCCASACEKPSSAHLQALSIMRRFHPRAGESFTPSGQNPLMDDLDYITAAAPKTLAGGCVAGGMHHTGAIDDTPAHAIDYRQEFLVDAAADRFAQGVPGPLVLDGTTEYAGSGKMGRWVRRTLPAGRRADNDPRYALAVLKDGVADLKRGPELWAASQFDLAFDRTLVGAIRPGGLNPRWTTVTGSVVIAGGGTVRELTIRLGGDGSYFLQTTWSFRWLEVPAVIAVPDPRRVIDEETYRREEEENAFR